MRDVLRARVRPVVERLVDDLTELAVRRVEVEVERMREACEVALSAYASGASDTPAAPPDLLERALGPEIAAMMNAPAPRAPAIADRDIKPAKLPEPAPPRAPEAEPQRGAPRFRSDGKRIGAVVCSKCGFVGGNARGCGRAHETLAPAAASAAQASLPPAASAATPERRDAIAAAQARRAAPPPPARYMPPEQDDEPEPDIDEAIARAEANKRPGELPVPRSSWGFGGQG